MSAACKIVIRGTVRHQGSRQDDLKGFRVDLLGYSTEGPLPFVTLERTETDESGRFLLRADVPCRDAVPMICVTLYDRRFVANPYCLKIVRRHAVDEDAELTLEPRDTRGDPVDPAPLH